MAIRITRVYTRRGDHGETDLVGAFLYEVPPQCVGVVMRLSVTTASFVVNRLVYICRDGSTRLVYL